jgi:5-methylcytosine-specific restriction endonuclease McrA
MRFFKRRNVSLNKAVTLEWARLLEEINVGVPKLIAKIEDEIPSRDLTTERDALEPFEKNCFYCETLLETAEINVEHVIPFSYIRENEMWNLTLACKQCNCKKLGSLPSPKEKWLGKLFERNKNYRNEISMLGKSLKRLGDNHESIIGIRYDNAEDLGFLPISMD